MSRAQSLVSLLSPPGIYSRSSSSPASHPTITLVMPVEFAQDALVALVAKMYALYSPLVFSRSVDGLVQLPAGSNTRRTSHVLVRLWYLSPGNI